MHIGFQVLLFRKNGVAVAALGEFKAHADGFVGHRYLLDVGAEGLLAGVQEHALVAHALGNWAALGHQLGAEDQGQQRHQNIRGFHCLFHSIKD